MYVEMCVKLMVLLIYIAIEGRIVSIRTAKSSI